MIIRPATLLDVGSICVLAEAQADRWFPKLVPDYTKIKKTVVASVSASQHFCWVAEERGQLMGVLIGLTGDNLWAKKQHATIALWTSLFAGGGIALLRKFKEWVLSRPAIVVAGFTPDLELDSRVYRLLERNGFKKSGGSYLLLRG